MKIKGLFLVLVMLIVILSGCGVGAKITPGVYEPILESYDAYDATVLSGLQVASTLKHLHGNLAVVVIKGEHCYVLGDLPKTSLALEGATAVDYLEHERLIDINRSYESSVLRNKENQVIGIQLTESIASKNVIADQIH